MLVLLMLLNRGRDRLTVQDYRNSLSVPGGEDIVE